MWKQWVKTGVFGLGVYCLGLFAGANVQAASVSDALRAMTARQQYTQVMGHQKTGLEQTDPELDSIMKKIYIRRHCQSVSHQSA